MCCTGTIIITTIKKIMNRHFKHFLQVLNCIWACCTSFPRLFHTTIVLRQKDCFFFISILHSINWSTDHCYLGLSHENVRIEWRYLLCFLALIWQLEWWSALHCHYMLCMPLPLCSTHQSSFFFMVLKYFIKHLDDYILLYALIYLQFKR